MKIVDYLKETKGELKHITWPTKKQTIWFTAISIVISVFIAFFLGFFDIMFSLGLDKFIL